MSHCGSQPSVCLTVASNGPRMTKTCKCECEVTVKTQLWQRRAHDPVCTGLSRLCNINVCLLKIWLKQRARFWHRIVIFLCRYCAHSEFDFDLLSRSEVIFHNVSAGFSAGLPDGSQTAVSDAFQSSTLWTDTFSDTFKEMIYCRRQFSQLLYNET